MINYGRVYGDTVPKPVEVTAGMVYVASNVQPYTKTFDDRETSGYVFDYIAYTKEEYIQILSDKNDALTAELLDTQEALCDIYEMLEGGLL